MKLIWGVLGAILATASGAAILGDLVSQEVRGRLDRLPYALIRLAVRRVSPDIRQSLAEEWTAELHAILRGIEALPITQLYRGTRYGFGLLRVAPSVSRALSTSTPRAVDKANIPPRRLATPVLARGLGNSRGDLVLAHARTLDECFRLDWRESRGRRPGSA